MNDVFSPAWGSTIDIVNAVAATTAVAIPKNCDALVLTNTSGTARTHVYLTEYQSEGEALPTGIAPTLSNGLAILPNSQIAIRCGQGLKAIRAIATLADGSLLVTPGNFT